MVYALVTGTSRGLGRLVADHLKTSYDVIEMYGSHQCDFNNPESVESYGESLRDKEILKIVHCAGGGFGFKEPLLDHKKFQQLFNVNVLAPSILNKILTANMMKAGKGNIIHIGSIASKQSGASVGYSCVKAALDSYVRNLGRELAQYGIIVSGISPGSFIAPGNNWSRYFSEKPAWLNKYLSDLPLKSIGNGEELLPIIDLLLLDSSRVFAGCMIPTDWGQGVT